MILELIDRRTRIPATEDRSAWPEPRLSRADLATLTAGLGRPEWRVDLVLVDDLEMARLNGEYRDQPEITDVLSFSSLVAAGTGSPDLPAGEARARCDLWVDPVDVHAAPEQMFPVGEVVLAPEFILRRCTEKGWRPESELALLVVHGCLHLLGWEHESADARLAMQAAEAEILHGIGMNHPMIEGS